MTQGRAKRKAVVSWSGGKDCAWALAAVSKDPSVEVALLWTTVREDTGNVGVHEVPFAALEAQAESLGLPIEALSLPWPCSNVEYEAKTRDCLSTLRYRGFEIVVFGDIFLEDIRAYREALLGGTGLEASFPLWQRATMDLGTEMVEGGLEAEMVAVDSTQLGSEWLGRSFDRSCLEDLPRGVDPCGENGEFHTFVRRGPGFRWTVDLSRHRATRTTHSVKS